MSTATVAYPVRKHDGDSANGVASIVGALLEQNLQQFPWRLKTTRAIKRPVSVYSIDTDTAATVIFGDDEAVIYNDIVGQPAVIVRATTEQILDVSQLPMRAGGLLPTGFFTRRGLRVLGSIGSRTMIVNGLLTHTVTSLRLISLVSVQP